MKKNIHPKKYQVKVILLNQESIIIETTNKSLDNKSITLDQDPNTNPAWTGKIGDGTKKKGKAELFATKYSGFDIS